MKENTKYHNYRFLGKFVIDEIQPWYDFASTKPWDESEIPWVLENRVRREIIISLVKGSKNFEELYNIVNFSPSPILVSKEEYECKVNYQWTKETLKNHLLSLEWYNLIKKNKNDEYELAFPILKTKELLKLEKFIILFAENWIRVIKEIKHQISLELEEIAKKIPLYEILIEKAVEKLYNLLKIESLIPDEPNIKLLWAEQLRKIKFEEWVDKTFN
ncbi:MAG: hypothetical protein ACFFAN_20700 [Promethearchaeota archaeon]